MKHICIIVFFALVGCVGGEKSSPEIVLPASYEASEPASGSVDVLIPITLSRNGFEGEVSYTASIRHISTTLSDVSIEDEYTGAFAEGAVSSQIRVVVHADAIKEPDEFFEVLIQSDDATVSSNVVRVKILDAGNPTKIYMKDAFRTMARGTNAGRIAVQVAYPSSINSYGLSIAYSGSAGRGKDFSASLNSLVVEPGVSEVNIPIDILTSSVRKSSRIVTITIAAPGIVDEQRATTTVLIPGDYQSNDTGVVSHWNGSSLQGTASPDYPKQDAEYGIDVGASSSDGHAGFSFTRLDFAGNPVSAVANHRCVKDENTGLIWEVKTDSLSLPVPASGSTYKEFIDEAVRRSKLPVGNVDYTPYPYHGFHAAWQTANYGYYWFNADSNSNGGSAGAQGETSSVGYFLSAACAFPNETQSLYSAEATRCNSKIYVDFANSAAVCGVKDWRLPSIEELRSIVNYEPGSPGLIPFYFPNMAGLRVMSSTPYSREKGAYWCLDADTKRVQLCNKQYPESIMLVRGVPL